MKVLDDEPSSFEQIAEVLRDGGIVCYPTETFYALGVDPWNASACERLYRLKQRSSDKELPLIAANVEMVSKFLDTSDKRVQVLAQKFWPGPLTLVIRSADQSTTYAIRVSSHPDARKISEAFGKPVVSTSANISGTKPIASPGELTPHLISGIDVLLDGGICAGGRPSTIVSILKPDTEILREGVISSKEILSLL